jgi:hypothetical protein
MNNNKCHRIKSFLRSLELLSYSFKSLSLQNTQVHYYFHHSLTHTLSPNFFSPPIFCTHTHSSLNNIAIRAHMFSTLRTPCWHTKMRDTDQKQNPHLTYHSHNSTNNTQRNSNHNHHQL